MKLFRKVMSGLLAGSLILSLVACGAGPGATETGDPSGNGAVGTPSASGDEIVVNVSDNVTLPIGVEIDGAIDQDELVLQLSAQLERAAPWSERKPPIYVSEI